MAGVALLEDGLCLWQLIVDHAVALGHELRLSVLDSVGVVD